MTTFEIPESDREPTLRERATEWIASHPEILSLFEQFAGQMLKRRQPFGMKALAERVRWECAFRWNETVKINNNFTAYIARELVRRLPGLEDLIETRVTRAADRPARDVVKDQRVDPLNDEPIDEDGA